MADDDLPNQDIDAGDDQGEARNDVVVKIGLVGDAQVWTNSFVSTDSCFTQ